MTKAKELIDWYWSEIEVLRSSKTHYVLHDIPLYDEGPCQCSTEKIIEDSRNPDRMRSFLMIGVLIDQMMWTHHYEMYSSFRSVFRYPKLYTHWGGGMASPGWFTYTGMDGRDKKINWTVVSEIAQALLSSLYEWFIKEGKTDELKGFQNWLKQESNQAFQSVNSMQLIPILEKLETV